MPQADLERLRAIRTLPQLIAYLLQLCGYGIGRAKGPESS